MVSTVLVREHTFPHRAKIFCRAIHNNAFNLDSHIEKSLLDLRVSFNPMNTGSSLGDGTRQQEIQSAKRKSPCRKSVLITV